MNPSKRSASGGLTVLVLLAVAMLLAMIPAGSWAGPKDQARQDAANQAVASLLAQVKAKPSDFESIRRVAILPLKGDSDKQVGDYLVTAFVQTPFAVIERDRAQIETLLSEHKFSADEFEDLFSARKETVARLGEFLGADAYLLGKVVSETHTGDTSEVVLNIRLLNVQTAQVLWSDTTTGKASVATSSLRQNAAWLGLVAAVVLLAAIVFGWKATHKPAPVSNAPRLLNEDHALRMHLATVMAQAQTFVGQARSKASRGNQSDLAESLRNLDNRLASFKRIVQDAEFRGAARRNPDPASLDRMVEFDRMLRASLKTLESHAATMSETLGNDPTASVQQDLVAAERSLTEIEARFKERSDFLRGVL